MPELLAFAAAVTVLLTAAGAVWRALTPARRLGKRAGEFFEDWNGSEARPGHEAVPSVPARLASLETRQRDQAHFVRGELTSRVELVRLELSATSTGVVRMDGRLDVLERRVTDHRRRNEQQVELLREAVARIEARGAHRRWEDCDDEQHHHPESRE